jgi:hypothetical protein
MPAVWFRLTDRFGLPDDAPETDDIICAAIGPILRADGEDLVRAPLPKQFSTLLGQLAQRERELSVASRRGSARSEIPSLVVEIADQCNGPATALTIAPPSAGLSTTGASDHVREAPAAS